MSKPYLKVTSDFTKDFNTIIKGFKRDAILIGIPQEDTARDEDAPINNATILAINEFGSEHNNIPPRPVMSIGIRNAQDEIAEAMKNACKFALSKGLSALSVYYNRAGIIASNSVKKAFKVVKPPEPETIAARKAAGHSSTAALVVTGQLRRAITYVVKGE